MTARRLAFAAVSGLLLAACRTAPPAAPAFQAFPIQKPASVAVPPAGGPIPTDDMFWRMSRDPGVVDAGQRAFGSSSCGSCHGFMLTGGTGPNLIDRAWLHGGTPSQVYQTISQGVPSKGMPTWGPVLGSPTIASIVAYIFSLHQEGESVVVQTSFTPGSPAYSF